MGPYRRFEEACNQFISLVHKLPIIYWSTSTCGAGSISSLPFDIDIEQVASDNPMVPAIILNTNTNWTDKSKPDPAKE